MTQLDGQVAIELLKFLKNYLDERMNYAKTHKDERSINIAGFCAELKAAISREKSRIYGRL